LVQQILTPNNRQTKSRRNCGADVKHQSLDRLGVGLPGLAGWPISNQALGGAGSLSSGVVWCGSAGSAAGFAPLCVWVHWRLTTDDIAFLDERKPKTRSNKNHEGAR
jgi:hypothetical protein